MSNLIIATAEKTIKAPAQEVFQVLSDPQLYGKFQSKPFYDYKVEKDVKGEGAIVTYKIDFAGGTKEIRMLMTVPAINSQIVWTDQNDTGLTTTFTFTSSEGATKVKIEAKWEGQDGAVGKVEKIVSPIRMHSVYKKELARIQDYFQK